MSLVFPRGCVVVRGGRYGVVWAAQDGYLVLLPVVDPVRAFSYDVTLDLAGLVACGVPIAGAVIRAWAHDPVPETGYRVAGTVPGTVMCQVVRGVIRTCQESVVHERWTAGRRHRAYARERCVNLVG